MRRLTLTCLAAAALAASPIVTADTAHGQLTKTVRYAGLDLNSPAGAEALYRRIARAAESVCKPLEGSLRMLSRHEQCMADAMGNAVAQVDHPQLTRHHRDMTDGKAPQHVASR